MATNHAAFVDPNWDAPLNVEAALAAIPKAATISGMFLQPMVDFAHDVGHELPASRARYVPFSFYPLHEHATLLIATCTAAFPKLTTRQALRKLGRGAPQALLRSTIGKVVLGSAAGVHAMVDAMVAAYPINLKPSRTSVLEHNDRSVVVRLTDIHYFLDSHHVGTFEGLLRHAGVEGTVRIASRSTSDADLLLSWR